MSWPVGVYKINNNAVDIDFVGCKHGVMMEKMITLFSNFSRRYLRMIGAQVSFRTGLGSNIDLILSPEGRDFNWLLSFTILKNIH